MHFNRLIEALPVIGYGMLGIFIVIGVLCGIVFLLTKLLPNKDEDTII